MNTPLRCLLIDDEPGARSILRAHIAAIPSLEVAGECANALQAFEFLRQHPVDLLFLDVQMPLMNGVAFLRSLPSPPRVIFTTAHRDYAVEGFELNAVDYLLKPVSLERLMRAVFRVIGQDDHPAAPPAPAEDGLHDRFLYFRTERRMQKVMLRHIRYVESLKDYVRIFCSEGKPVVTKQTISSLGEILPEEHFFRIHRSYIINLGRITSYSPAHVYIDGEELPVGPVYRKDLQRRLRKG